MAIMKSAICSIQAHAQRLPQTGLTGGLAAAGTNTWLAVLSSCHNSTPPNTPARNFGALTTPK
jgi:hypothetical protein